MDDTQRLRRFNRTVTRRIGVLTDDYLGHGRPLAESRLLFEVGRGGSDVRDLRARLALDSGYASRLLKSLEAKMGEAEYEVSLKGACDPEREAFRVAVTTANKSSGYSAADAADNAEMQIEDYHAGFTDKFADYSSSNTLPPKE